MCLIVRGNIKITKKDRVVYKVFYEIIKGTIVSPFRGKTYILGKTYRIKTIEIITRSDTPKVKNIYKGYHAYTTLPTATKNVYSNFKRIYRAIIPAGS